MIPPVTGTYEQERLALWLELTRIGDAATHNAALIGATKEKLEGDTQKDLNILGAKVRKVETSVLVIKTKALAYGTAAGLAATLIMEAVRYLRH